MPLRSLSALLPEALRRALGVASLSILTLGCGHAEPAGGAGHAEDAEHVEADPVAVRTAPAERRDLEHTVIGIGRCEALPKKFATLTPAVAGQIAKLHKEVGERVERDEVIAELDPQIAAADLAEKSALRDTLAAALDLLVAPPRPEDRKGLELTVAQAKASVERTNAALERLRPLRRAAKFPKRIFTKANKPSFRPSSSKSRPRAN